MVKNINIDINSVESIINGAVSDIGAVQDDINKIYSDLNKCLSEAFGDEADALREQLTVESALATAFYECCWECGGWHVFDVEVIDDVEW